MRTIRKSAIRIRCLVMMGAALVVQCIRMEAMEHDLVISVYQGVCQEGDFAANLATVRTQVAAAQARGSDFVVFPEAFLSGYESREAVQSGARPLEDPELKRFIEQSASHDMVVLAGMARKAGDGIYNTELVIHRGRLLGYYDKVMLTGGDSGALGFKPGTAVPVFQAHGVRFAVAICHDSSFPHLAMAARLQGAEILFTPHNNEIGAPAAADHRTWVRNCHVGLACQLKMVVARANIVKSDRPGLIGYGDSFILSPQGAPLAEAKLFKDELITATVTPAMFQAPWVWADASEVPAWLRAQLSRLMADFRRPASDAELQFWLENMVVFHRFTPAEVSAATGLTLDEIAAARRRFGLADKRAPRTVPGEPLRVLPYPGGRHPRLGFFDGAVMPQRETKVSVFTPWDEASYVVVDVPEAIFSNLGLVYLAHAHIPTLWDLQGITLPRQEWSRGTNNALESARTLPNGIGFHASVWPGSDSVRMELTLRNGTREKITGLRVQNCVMLGHAAGFEAQTTGNKIFQPPYAAVRASGANRWIVTGWDPVQRCWGNELCPCMHSDPQFPDCDPGQIVRVRGWLSFYEGADIEAELKRIQQAGWQNQ